MRTVSKTGSNSLTEHIKNIVARFRNRVANIRKQHTVAISELRQDADQKKIDAVKDRIAKL